MQGDTRIIDLLNRLLTGELTAVDQYLIHGEIYRNLGLHRLADISLHESDHERQHALALIQRILFLDGMPDLSERDPLNIGQTVPAMLQADLNLEYHVAAELKKAIAACEITSDYVTRDMLFIQLDDTEMDHAYWLEQHMELIRLVRLENYQQSQMDTSSPYLNRRKEHERQSASLEHA